MWCSESLQRSNIFCNYMICVEIRGYLCAQLLRMKFIKTVDCALSIKM